MIEKVTQAVDYIKNICTTKPEIGIILGTGLSSFAQGITIEAEIFYGDIPHFPISTVIGHSGKLIFGELKGKKVVAMAGRFHYYEGYSASAVIFPVRVMKYLGVKTLLVSNAAGSVNPDYEVGDLMIITDHISQFSVNPLVGKNEDEFGPRFPDMSEPYSKELIQKAKQIALAKGIEIREGVYIGVTGPTFETRAEYKMIQILGGDAVGMSTVQEVIAAVHMGMQCFAMSVITDVGIRESENKITHEEVLHAAREAEPKFAHVFKELVAQI
jgi:purine-nucleoside phosphorylase